MSTIRRARRLLTPSGVLRRAVEGEDTSQALPWHVSAASNASQLREALTLRTAAYGRHFDLSGSADPISEVDTFDFAPGALLLIARDKSSGNLVGTMRVAFGVGTEVEMSRWHPIPSRIANLRLGEARRLALKPSRSATLVKLSLWKAFWLACATRGIEAMLVAARPPLSDDYRMLLFEEPLPGGVFFTPPDVPDRHELLMLRLQGLPDRYRRHSLELYRFMVLTHHPDIDAIDSNLSNPLASLSVDAIRDLGRTVTKGPGFGLRPITG